LPVALHALIAISRPSINTGERERETERERAEGRAKMSSFMAQNRNDYRERGKEKHAKTAKKGEK